MVETIASAAVMGVEVHRVRVEVSITLGTPMIQIVGMAQNAVREGRERIRAAAAQLKLRLPGLRITVNLAPAALPKGGAAFDLPITVGILAAAGELPPDRARRWAMVGELGLDGVLRPVRGALPIALHAERAGDVEGLILPIENLREAAPVGLPVRGAGSLTQVLDFLRATADLATPADLPPAGAPGLTEHDLRAVRGQAAARRALEIAAAGGHNLLLSGVPGAGKTTIARCLPSILPPMQMDEAVEVTTIHSVAGRLPVDAGLLAARPFRSPHHSISEAGLIGGGSPPRPGEISLAHRGVLFLDELPEFGNHVLESLRQPLEEGVVHVVRARAAATFPAGFMLVAAMNPCPCGFATGGGEACTCDPDRVRRYLSRVSGPLLDRIDLHVELPAVTWEELSDGSGGEPSAAARRRVVAARRTALDRQSVANGDLDVKRTLGHCRIGGPARAHLRRAVERRGLSARGYHRALRVARTIADIERSEAIEPDHVAEALRYRLPRNR